MKPNIEKNAEGDAEKLATVQSELEIAKAYGELNDAQKVHYGTLSDEGKTLFLAKSAKERNAELEDIAKGDPVVYEAMDGTKIRKSDGDLVLKMAKDNDEIRKELALNKAASANERFSKRAKDELGHMAGEEATHIALLKAVDGIENEETRGKVEEVLKSANAAMGQKFTSLGSSVNPTADPNAINKSADANAKLEALAKARVSEKGVDYFTAYEEVSNENPALAKQAIG